MPRRGRFASGKQSGPFSAGRLQQELWEQARQPSGGSYLTGERRYPKTLNRSVGRLVLAASFQPVCDAIVEAATRRGINVAPTLKRPAVHFVSTPELKALAGFQSADLATRLQELRQKDPNFKLTASRVVRLAADPENVRLGTRASTNSASREKLVVRSLVSLPSEIEEEAGTFRQHIGLEAERSYADLEVRLATCSVADAGAMQEIIKESQDRLPSELEFSPVDIISVGRRH